ncbi:MAG: ABC transporter substrate-binding protein [Pseudoflavonifractor sp.]
MKKLFPLLLALLLALCACSPAPASPTAGAAPAALTVTDLLGRTITLPAAAKTAVCIGAGAQRLYCYVAPAEKLVGIEQISLDGRASLPYMLADPGLENLPVIGQGGPANVPDPEQLLLAAPEVIFSCYNSDAAQMDALQEKTGIPVVTLSMGSDTLFSPDVDASLTLIGTIMGEQARAAEVIRFFGDQKADLAARTADVAEQDRPLAYLGALSFKGAHGIESTDGSYSLFAATGIRNAAGEHGVPHYAMIDKELLLEADPPVIILDGGGLGLVREDMDKNPGYYAALTAFQTGQVYLQLPYNYYSTNLGTALADAYYLGWVLYPAQFSDVEISAKADEIYTFLLGAPVYAQMASAYYGGFGRVTF